MHKREKPVQLDVAFVELMSKRPRLTAKASVWPVARGNCERSDLAAPRRRDRDSRMVAQAQSLGVELKY